MRFGRAVLNDCQQAYNRACNRPTRAYFWRASPKSAQTSGSAAIDRTVSMLLNASSATRMAPANSFCIFFERPHTSLP